MKYSCMPTSRLVYQANTNALCTEGKRSLGDELESQKATALAVICVWACCFERRLSIDFPMINPIIEIFYLVACGPIPDIDCTLKPPLNPREPFIVNARTPTNQHPVASKTDLLRMTDDHVLDHS